jgi:DNA-binding beta-propeller fold protein YncE
LVIPRWVLGVIAVGVVVAAIDVAVFVVAHDGAEPAAARAATKSKDLVAVIDVKSRRVVDRLQVGDTPTLVVAGYGGAWVLNKGDGTLTHIDGSTHRIVETRRLDVTVTDLALGDSAVWVVGRMRSDISHPLEFARIERIDPTQGRIDRRLQTSTGASVLAAGGDALWTTGLLPGRVRGAARLDARTGALRRVNIEIYGDLITADDRAAYWVGSAASRVARVSTRTGLLTNSLPLATDASLAAGHVPPNPTDVAVGGGALWISAVDGSVLRVDPSLHGIVATIPACRNALALAYGAGAVWVACGDATVVRVDPQTDQAGPPIPVGALPRGIAASGGAVWVTLN